MKQLLVDAICGAGFGSMKEADYYTKLGLAKFTGNLLSEKWDWDVDSLNALSEETLCGIYFSINAPTEISWWMKG